MNPTNDPSPSRVVRQLAVIGTGLAGALMAQALAQAGHTVQVFDKARGPGGRLATRRFNWTAPDGSLHTTHLDHGAPGFAARSPAFMRWAEAAQARGWLGGFDPALAPGSPPLSDGEPWFLTLPEGPALCRHLLAQVPATWACAVDGLRRERGRWRLTSAGQTVADDLDAVLLAIPPAQAAPLLAPHRADWAAQAAATAMQPCWTLMGVAQADADHPDWAVARPATGPLAWLARNDRRPGRATVAEQAHWVAHASLAWTQAHLDRPAAEVQAALQTAVAAVLGQPVQWLGATAHRWLYAQPGSGSGPAPAPCWWDAGLGLGACGDFLGAARGAGVERAWLSGQALSAMVLMGRRD